MCINKDKEERHTYNLEPLPTACRRPLIVDKGVKVEDGRVIELPILVLVDTGEMLGQYEP